MNNTRSSDTDRDAFQCFGTAFVDRQNRRRATIHWWLVRSALFAMIIAFGLAGHAALRFYEMHA